MKLVPTKGSAIVVEVEKSSKIEVNSATNPLKIEMAVRSWEYGPCVVEMSSQQAGELIHALYDKAYRAAAVQKKYNQARKK